jgi:hypothetical protein
LTQAAFQSRHDKPVYFSNQHSVDGTLLPLLKNFIQPFFRVTHYLGKCNFAAVDKRRFGIGGSLFSALPATVGLALRGRTNKFCASVILSIFSSWAGQTEEYFPRNAKP